MATLLQINSGVFSDNSQSSKLANQIVSTWAAKNPEGAVVKHDLTSFEIPHLDSATIGAFFTPADQRSDEQKQAVALSDQLIAEVKAADIIVVGVPMYNLSIPSPLKAWIDHICRAGETFKYNEQGQPVGLVGDKKVIIAAARGGLYEGSAYDTQTEWLKHIFGLIGITSLEFVYAEGLAMGEEKAKEGFANAEQRIESLAI
ncbi:FMN-dependent NADH-azoreductase [Gynuella sunshinyii]|uniref:FMN dependent NADH:quinone oxidoreductase n=1 Tax=Gynuella sunshinyii YC6258 TaxID=1445510 RepID=A0A0C5VUA0_9GAMM|nr:NAD(P)H-dependent oxidoreductase [Gynuella sunshinyii]AJQ96888.1 acyl carrier protein phosphodiesterase [Gynuella sunshinyii YC6258]